MISCKIFPFTFLLTALIIKNIQPYSGWNLIYFSKKVPKTKLEKRLIPNLNLSEKIGKFVIKEDKFQGFYAN